jgi:hypothetical protein
MDFYQQMLCDTRKGVVYGTRLSESGFAIANPYLSRVLRLLFGTSIKKVTKNVKNKPKVTYISVSKKLTKKSKKRIFDQFVTFCAAHGSYIVKMPSPWRVASSLIQAHRSYRADYRIGREQSRVLCRGVE